MFLIIRYCYCAVRFLFRPNIVSVNGFKMYLPLLLQWKLFQCIGEIGKGSVTKYRFLSVPRVLNRIKHNLANTNRITIKDIQYYKSSLVD